ncbi:hypothetical protein MYSTI_05268 [Myxococcus stipitatus DSM 14675]|uniref:Uncharacterized protein n=1 Tax=Myxococcus stipitatus (strain DSM 14675 / JCM 12634 / Mx s8) TaxID=1278073 RepID=L7UES1_MYXSD|nr:hypothetical protein [Myxococcus stipitatus]AGC46548.1 hypothetical protein MYSTI_05268 [Myxococcus stipitatus DSM 14675]
MPTGSKPGGAYNTRPMDKGPSLQTMATEALANIERYAELGAAVSEKVALLNFKNSLQHAQDSTLTKVGETISSSARDSSP